MAKAKKKPKETLETTPVWCSHTKMVDVVSLVPHPRNPNRHPENQIRMLAKIIKHQGWRSPIVVSKRSGFIIKGHGRLAAALMNGWAYVPVDMQDYATEADEWADLVADNRIAELAEPDNVSLVSLMDEMGAFDMELLGFDADAIAALVPNVVQGLDDGKEFDEDAADDVQMITCPHCAKDFPKP